MNIRTKSLLLKEIEDKKSKKDEALILVYADLLEEDGELDLAYAYRWCVRNNKWPGYGINYKGGINYRGVQYYFYYLHNYELTQQGISYSYRHLEYCLPFQIFSALRSFCDTANTHYIVNNTLSISEYKSIEECITALSKSLAFLKKEYGKNIIEKIELLGSITL